MAVELWWCTDKTRVIILRKVKRSYALERIFIPPQKDISLEEEKYQKLCTSKRRDLKDSRIEMYCMVDKS